MARLPRETLSVFAGSASNQGTFGSSQAGTPTVSTSPVTVQSLGAWEAGWLDAVIGGQKLPPLEEFQGVQFVHSYMTAYLMQEGIPEYDAGTTYYNNAIVKDPSTFILYGSVGSGPNIGNSLSNASFWTKLVDLSNVTGVQAAYGLTTNVSNAYSVTTTPAITAPAVGQIYSIKFNAANTGAATLNVGGSGAIGIIDHGGSAFVGGELVANRTYPLVYNGTNFQLLVSIFPETSYGVTTNSTNAYSVTTTPTFGILKTGQTLNLQLNAANTGSITLNANGTGAVTVHDVDGNALASGAITANETYAIVYNGTNFVILGLLASVNPNVGSFTNANVTVDAKGRVTAAANGTNGLTLVAPTSFNSSTTYSSGAIPAGIKQLNILLDSVTTSANSNLLFQLNTLSSGYTGGGTNVNSSAVSTTSVAGAVAINSASLAPFTGKITFDLADATNNVWVASYVINNGSQGNDYGGTRIALSGPLTGFDFTTVGGTATWNAGKISYSYQ